MTESQFNAAYQVAAVNLASLAKTLGRDRELATIREALRRGLLLPDTHSGFDALVMLDDLIQFNRDIRRRN